MHGPVGRIALDHRTHSLEAEPDTATNVHNDCGKIAAPDVMPYGQLADSAQAVDAKAILKRS